MTIENLKEANKMIEAIDVKGKDYAPVNERIKAFRAVCPNGSVTTEIVYMDGGVVTMKATITDEEGRVISTGLAQEKESSSFINKTSYVENCETSAVGRALGFAGIGVDGSICSAEELANALNNQGKPESKPVPDKPDRKVTSEEAMNLKRYCKKEELPEEAIYGYFKRKSIGEMTKADFDVFYKDFKAIIATWKKNHEDTGEA